MHVFGNSAKLRNIVAAFRVVVVTDIARAPNRFVIAHAQLPPNIPSVENRNNTWFCPVLTMSSTVLTDQEPLSLFHVFQKGMLFWSVTYPFGMQKWS